MRNLSQNEIQNVSGGLLGADFFGNLGQTIGDIVDKSFKSNTGLDPAMSAVGPAKQLGQGIRYIIDSIFNPLLIPQAVSNMINGISGIVNVSKANKQQLANAH